MLVMLGGASRYCESRGAVPGLSDRLLLQKLESCGGGAQARQIAEQIVPRALGEARGSPSWPTQESDWERARRAVLDAIEVHCGKTAHIAR